MTVTVTDPDFNFSELDWKAFRYGKFSGHRRAALDKRQNLRFRGNFSSGFVYFLHWFL